MSKIACRLFGHEYTRATTGMTAINGKPVLYCTRCGKEWFPEAWCPTWLTKRDKVT